MQELPLAPETLELDPGVCRRARIARDSRFDGEFFIAVRTTGIYCRPVCPARTPAEKNVRYYRHAAEPARDGYRPCLRCRPESAPGSPGWLGTASTLQRALRLIREGALNDAPLSDLAKRLGIGERYLRKLFEREIGLAPSAVAHNGRLLFARKLLNETQLPITQIAFAAGFGSVRRFNSAIQEHWKCTPGELRAKHKLPKPPQGTVQLLLYYRPPYDWQGVLNFFKRHLIEEIERVEGQCYSRHIVVDGESASFQVSPHPKRPALQVCLQVSNPAQWMPLVAKIRRMFDLDANPAVIAEHLGADPAMAALLERFPGVRSPVLWSVFESAVRAIAGQQVSTSAARKVCERLTRATLAAGAPRAFPAPNMVAKLPDEAFGMPTKRRATLRELSSAFAQAELDSEQLLALKGVGPWTVRMVDMRGRGATDVFPLGDLGLVKAWESLPQAKGELAQQLEHWRPWGSYATNLLWRSLGPT